MDLFAGSGIVALEAASRGATPVVLVEGDSKKRATVQKNLKIAEGEPIRLHICRVEQFLKRLQTPYDLIFLDPPFPYANKQWLVEEIERRKLVVPNGRVMIHHPRREVWSASYGHLSEIDCRNYGNSILRMYRMEGGAPVLEGDA